MRKGVKRKNYYLDEGAIKEAQQVLGTKTETETIQKALELVADQARLVQALKDLLDKGKGPGGAVCPPNRTDRPDRGPHL